jgi:hypothetical protein
MAEGFAVIVSKADPAYTEKPVADMRIEIIGAQPDYESLDEAARYYDNQARQIEEALHRSLPGGTYDRLVGRMLARKATHFRVAHFDGEEASNA